MSITQPNGPSMGVEHNQTPSSSHGTSLKTPEPQKCCSGGNCAECGKQQPVVESSPEIAAIEQQILSGDFAGFFDSLTSSRETVAQTIGIDGIVTSGEGTVVQVGQTASTVGTIGPAQSALRYHEAPSPLLSGNLGSMPTAERLVSIGSVPKQAASEGFSSTGSLRESISGATDTRFAAATSSHLYASTPSGAEKTQRTEPVQGERPVERTTEVRATEHKPESVREVEKVAAPKIEQQETKLWVNTAGASTSSTYQSTTSYSSPFFSSTSPAMSRSAAAQSPRRASSAPRSSRTVALQQPVSLSVSRSVATGSFRAHTRAPQPRQGSELKTLTRSLNLIRNLGRFAQALSRGGEIVTPKASRQATRALQQIERLVRTTNSVGRSPQQRKALDNLRAVAQALVGRRNARDNKMIARVMSNALRRLGYGIEKRVARLTPARSVASTASARALTRKALFNAQLQNIRGRLDRLKTRYQAKATSGMTRRGGLKRSLVARTLGRRGQSAKQLLSRSTARASRRSATRESLTHRQTKSSARQRNKINGAHQRQEVRMLRREVRALRQSLQDLLPMMEMMKALSMKRRGLRREEDFDLRGFISERQLTALLKRKNLSSLERRKVERELAKRKKAKGTGSAMKSATSSSQKQNTIGTAASTKASEGAAQPKDAEMKSFAKSLSTFQMRTDDAADDSVGGELSD